MGFALAFHEFASNLKLEKERKNNDPGEKRGSRWVCLRAMISEHRWMNIMNNKWKTAGGAALETLNCLICCARACCERELLRDTGTVV